jgi:chromosome segregation ATPase
MDSDGISTDTQQLRERLQNEQKAITRVEDALQAEISKIGEEMSRVTITQPHARLQTADGSRLLDRVSQLESKVPIFIADLTERNTAIKKDLESSLTISERKAKKLDELYREANAENEILYDRFNDELGKIMSALKIGAGEKELAEKLREVQGELSACKKENARLKRENVGLRAQLKGD